MKRIKRSVGYALEGLTHAMETERNLQLFVPVYALVLIIGGFIGLLMWEWLALIIVGALFLSVELLNTSLERLNDALDHVRKLQGSKGLHAGIKASKDVGAAASLISLVAVIVVILIVFWPYAHMWIKSKM